MAWKYVQRNENGQYKTTEGGGGGGGASALTDLDDVSISSPSNGQVLKYNSTSQEWENANESGGAGHNYSTTEQVVGTWIDGKPLYEKTVDMGSLGNDILLTVNKTSVYRVASSIACEKAYLTIQYTKTTAQGE